jgi:hypothetical protein
MKKINRISFFNILLTLIAFMPPVIKEIFQFSSYTQGFIIAFFIYFLIFIFFFEKYKDVFNQFLSKSIIILFFIFIFYFIILIIKKYYFKFNVDLIKLYTFPLFSFILIFSSSLLYVTIRKSENYNLKKSIISILFIFILFGYFSVLGYSAYGKFTYRKPVFVYSEVSHYALGIGPFLCFSLLTINNRIKKYFVLFSILFFSLYIQSTTLLLTLLLIVFLIIKSPALKLLIITILVSFIFLFNSEYFINRVGLSSETSNETNWVYLQGLEEILISFKDTKGLGLGPQQMGVVDSKGEFAELVYQYSGDYVNRFDGSIGISKMLTEFGIFGIIFTITYVIYFFKAFKYLNNINLDSNKDYKLILGYSFIFIFFIYYFIRGGGYFGPNYLFLITGFYLTISKKNKNSKIKAIITS